MSLTTISATEALSKLEAFDTIIDARSESEYALDHLPGALNWPTLNDKERHDIGTMYVQVNAFEAKKRGAAIAARNIASHIENFALEKPKEWKPLAYCWRGGKRSGSLSLVLGQIGFRVTLLEGGYKAFRNAILQDIPKQIERLQFVVVCGTTGSGKTRFLQALQSERAQVLDLEALACHRSSVLGAVPGQAQPSQKHFDMLIWDTLRYFDASRPVYVESESKKVGNVSVPACLMEKIRQSPCINLELSLEERIALLLEDYDYFVQNPAIFCSRLDVLTQLRGKATIEKWKLLVHAGQISQVVEELLSTHYDPGYLDSIQRNFVQFHNAKILRAANRSNDSMKTLAQELLHTQSPKTI